MSEPAANPTPPTEPPVEAGEEGASTSKKAAKKAEAKAKKEAEKAKRAAERAATMAAQTSAASEDHATENYGNETLGTKLSTDAVEVSLLEIGEEHVGKKVLLRGWIQNSRMQGAKMVFVEIRERGNWAIQGIAAANAEGTVSRQMVKWIGSVNLESFVIVEGTIEKPLEPVKACRVSGYEVHITKFFVHAAAPQILGMTLATANRPITNFSDEQAPVDEGVEKLSLTSTEPAGIPAATMLTHLDNIVMHKRAPVQQAIADIRVEVKDLFREYLKQRGFKERETRDCKLTCTSLIGAASEGGANVFRLPYFGTEAFLAQSPQFYKQIEIAGGRKRVFSISPVFRAENSNTPRHMTEFTGMDLEMETRDYHEAIDVLEGVLLYIFRGLKERCAAEIELVRSVYPSEDLLLPEPGKEVRLTFAEGQALLRAEGPEEFRNVSDEEDMSTAQEKALGALVREKYKTDFYVLDKFPEGARPFYAKEDPLNPKVTQAYDFFIRGQEVLSGGQRINDPVELEARMRKKGVDPNSPGLKEYVQVFRSGCPSHSGGGIGLDRVVSWFLNLPSVSLAAYYPRTPKRLSP
ncbi:aspartyl-tRNA synthetase-like protein [Immersiella caudata]|uniref:Probable aspartate--tRNA ligase, cytoplasmic n=1 Tax=Immersiella caudata TaxID=314043 RepID=A0AA39XFM8_9PEZI|nr:aspartyl-tRNA synthetase-like protein [Immersiella caudata]